MKTVKTMKQDGGGLRHNKGKLRLDLFPEDVKRAVAEVLTHACTERQPPYPERNWERGMKWSDVVGSLERHLSDLKIGIRMDPSGSGLRTSALLACNAVFLCGYDIRGMHDLDDLEPHAREAIERQSKDALKRIARLGGKLIVHPTGPAHIEVGGRRLCARRPRDKRLTKS